MPALQSRTQNGRASVRGRHQHSHARAYAAAYVHANTHMQEMRRAGCAVTHANYVRTASMHDEDIRHANITAAHMSSARQHASPHTRAQMHDMLSGQRASAKHETCYVALPSCIQDMHTHIQEARRTVQHCRCACTTCMGNCTVYCILNIIHKGG